ADRAIAGEGTALRRRADRRMVEDDRPHDAADLGGSQHSRARPGAAAPAEDRVLTAQQVAASRAPSRVDTPPGPGPEQTARLRTERQRPDVDQVERQDPWGERPEIATDRHACPGRRGEPDRRRGRSHARERERARAAVDASVVYLGERAVG